MKQDHIRVSGMTCAACASRIERSLGKVQGIGEVRVSLALAQATIHYEPSAISVQDIIARIIRLGFGATKAQQSPEATVAAEVASYRRRFWTAAFLSMPLLWTLVAHLELVPQAWVPQLFMEPVFQWITASLLLFGAGYPFYHRAWQALLQRSANMDTLVALSSSVAYFYSHWLLFEQAQAAQSHHGLYFDAIAMILTAVLLGKWLESRARGQALQQLSALYGLQPPLLRIKSPSGERWIPSAQVKPGDRILIRSSEGIGVDGRVDSGMADVDESAMTGESAMILKTEGDRVYAGTRCMSGSLVIISEKNGMETRLAGIIGMIEAAQQSKPHLQRVVDRVAAVFVPVIIALAASTYAVWYVLEGSELAMMRAMAVLLVACPCALGLATPVSILVATGKAARSGVLYKSGRAVEQLSRANVILLDKTGTLTEGRPRVQAIHTKGLAEHEALRIAAAVANQSEHPLSQAILAAARERGITIGLAKDVNERPGKGVEGWVETASIKLGSKSWLAPVESNQIRWLESGQHQAVGRIRLYLTINDRCEAVFLLDDAIRKEASTVVRELERQAEVWMVTGDENDSATVVAEAVGIHNLRSNVSPEAKLAFVQQLQAEGRRVAMIGDGINDAAALAAAEVGIAMGGGTDAARQAGDIVLLRSRMTRLADAFRWSRYTVSNIHQNLIFALVYNAIAVPLAIAGLLDPRLACAGMAASSVLVVSNALRLGKRMNG